MYNPSQRSARRQLSGASRPLDAEPFLRRSQSWNTLVPDEHWDEESSMED
jgi:hypothetical protein